MPIPDAFSRVPDDPNLFTLPGQGRVRRLQDYTFAPTEDQVDVPGVGTVNVPSDNPPPPPVKELGPSRQDWRKQPALEGQPFQGPIEPTSYDPPGTQWLGDEIARVRQRQARGRPRENVEDLIGPEQAFAINKQWAKPGPYLTTLQPQEEQQFQSWFNGLKQQYGDRMFARPDDKAYDMRGFWKAMRAGDQRAKPSINPNDHTLHFPDVWKTPYDSTFSRESVHALPNAPHWEGDNLVTPAGRVLWDDQGGIYFGDQNAAPER
jgi:hypothetical protein